MKCPFAVWNPGPSGKQGYPSYPYGTARMGIVDHSAEGWRGGMLAVLKNPNAGSWHFSVYQDGNIDQHYDSDAVTWHCGVRPGWQLHSNATLIGIEHEGVAGQPLTEAQYQASLKLQRWLWGVYKWGEPKLGETLWEHRFLSATSCPSFRIPWDRLITDLKGVTMNKDRASLQGSIFLGRKWERPDNWGPEKDGESEAKMVIGSAEFQARLNTGWDDSNMPWKLKEEIARRDTLILRYVKAFEKIDLAITEVENP